jgi:hypothetical protein
MGAATLTLLLAFEALASVPRTPAPVSRLWTSRVAMSTPPQPGTETETVASAPLSAADSESARAELKAELFEVIAPLAIGFDSNEEQRNEVFEIVEELEALNPIARPLESDAISGMWSLIYTSSPSVRNVKGVMGINQWFKDARMSSFVHDMRREPNYMRYIEAVQFPGLVAKAIGNIAVAEGFWTQQEDEPNTMVTDANKVAIGPMKFDSDQWQSLRCLMIQDITYLDDELRIQHGLVPSIIFIFKKLPPGTVVQGA